jgi:hypothetical protein
MKVTTGPMLLLLTVGGLLFYLGQKTFEGGVSLAASPAYPHDASQPVYCIQDEAALARREGEVAAAETQLGEQSSDLERRLSEVAQRETALDARLAEVEAREAELAQGAAALEQERITINEEKDHQVQEDQRLKDLQVELDGRAAQLDQRESDLNTARIRLDGEKAMLRKQQDEFRLLLRVLYGLIALSFAILLAIIWLAYRLLLR